MSEFGGLQQHENIQHAPWVTKRDTVAAGPMRAARISQRERWHSEMKNGEKKPQMETFTQNTPFKLKTIAC